ncbi:MAG: hypothetical protein AABX25_04385 [Nanoarchaeota archaeon]
MTYKELKNFQEIFGRKDFSFISEPVNIGEISEIILTKLANPDGNDEYYISKLNLFMNNSSSFFNWLGGAVIDEIKEGYTAIQQILSQIIGLFKQPPDKLAAIGRGYFRKFNKTFLYGLSRIMKGIRTVFNPELVSATNIDRNQLERFIIDKREGLGDRYVFNTTGNHAFIRKLKLLNKAELIVAERLLLNPQKARRTRNGWIDFGEKRAPVRILVKPRTLLKDEVYFLFRISEHKDYDQRLNSIPGRFEFSAA